MMESQEELNLQLNPIMENGAAGQTGSMAVFLAGLVLGIVMGLFFASYLIKLGRGGKKSGKQLPPPKEFSSVVKKQGSESVSMRTGSTQSGSDNQNEDEADRLI